MNDTELTRQLAALMGWEVYTEQGGEYDRWQRRLVAGEHDRSCFIDLDGRVWVYDGEPLHTAGVYTTGSERLWYPLASMDDAMRVVEQMRERGYWYMITDERLDNRHLAEFRKPDSKGVHRFYQETASTPQRAIALAALKVGVGE